jgi:hypothetical protein
MTVGYLLNNLFLWEASLSFCFIWIPLTTSSCCKIGESERKGRIPYVHQRANVVLFVGLSAFWSDSGAKLNRCAWPWCAWLVAPRVCWPRPFDTCMLSAAEVGHVANLGWQIHSLYGSNWSDKIQLQTAIRGAPIKAGAPFVLYYECNVRRMFSVLSTPPLLIFF